MILLLLDDGFGGGLGGGHGRLDVDLVVAVASHIAGPGPVDMSRLGDAIHDNLEAVVS